MRLSELRSILREEHLDDIPDVTTATESDYRWPTTMLNRLINASEREACRRSDLIFDKTTVETCRITLVTDQEAYALSSYVRRVVRAVLDDNPLSFIMEEDLDRTNQGWRSHASSLPTHFYIQHGKIHFYPAPKSDYNGDYVWLHVYRVPLISMDDDECEPELPHEGDQEDMLHWAAYKAFNRPDEDTHNRKKADHHLALFERAFGKPVSGRDARHRLSRPRSIQFSLGTAYK